MSHHSVTQSCGLHSKNMRFGMLARMFASFMLVFGCASCSWIDAPLNLVARTFNPYRSELIQGNLVTQEQVQVLRVGMTRAQVKEILGTPLITSLFHNSRWDYAFTIRRAGQAVEQKRVSVYFDGEALARFEADELPTEAEFAAHIFIKRPSTKEPVALQATPEQLAQFKKGPLDSDGVRAEDNAGPVAPIRSNYPMLEPN